MRRREFILAGRRGGVAARGARAAAGDAGDRVSRRCISNFGPFSRTSADHPVRALILIPGQPTSFDFH
jgi:hypothetical protein